MLFEDDRRYNGEWDNDEMQGYGVMSYPNGDEYNGPFERGMLNCVFVFELHHCGLTYIQPRQASRAEGFSGDA